MSVARPGSPVVAELALQPLEQVRAVLAEVADARGDAVRVQREPDRVHRRLEQLRRDPVGEDGDRAVAGQQAPLAVDGDRGVGLVAGQHEVDGVADRRERGILQVELAVARREAAGEQQLVALAQRDVEALGERDDHVRARLGPPRLHEGHVAGGDAGLQRELELAEPAPHAPLAEQGSHGHEAHAIAAMRRPPRGARGPPAAAPRRGRRGRSHRRARRRRPRP